MVVQKDTRDIIIVVGAAVTVVAVLFSSVFVYSGLWPPFSVVESGSMQHGEESSIGTIDTGDMVVVVDKSKVEITSYVEGYRTGYSKFGEYGDVVIYHRLNTGNPIIHRVILWLEYDEIEETWSGRGLEHYKMADGTPLWENNSADPMSMTGTLTLHDIGYSSKTVSINLDWLVKTSGYLTMGDNSKTNTVFDQMGEISLKTLVSNERIMYVAGFEIPWIGCIKMYLTGHNVDSIPSNSIPSMVLTMIVLICAFVAVFVVVDYIRWYRDKGKDGE